jgi:hypothetical protein
MLKDNNNPENLTALGQRLVEGLEHQEELIEEIASVRRSQSTIRKLFAAVAVAVLVSFVASFFAIKTAHDVQDVQKAVATRTIETCQTRNGGARGTREAFDRYNDVLEAAFPDETEILANLREAIVPVGAAESDCNRDGYIDDKDYAPGVFPPLAERVPVEPRNSAEDASE